jgi:hypothetical protein
LTLNISSPLACLQNVHTSLLVSGSTRIAISRPSFSAPILRLRLGGGGAADIAPLRAHIATSFSIKAEAVDTIEHKAFATALPALAFV